VARNLHIFENSRPFVISQELPSANEILHQVRKRFGREDQAGRGTAAAPERLRPLIIRGGTLALPDRPGLSIEIDIERIEEASRLYQNLGSGARDDRKAMQFLVPG
jgi:hypothetical protein